VSAAPASEEELHAFLDGQLEVQRCAEVRAFLASSPAAAARVATWRRDAEGLRAALAGIETWPPNPSLDPAVIRRRMRGRAVRRASRSVCLLLALGLAGLVGWYARGVHTGLAGLPMQDAMDAYRVFGSARTHAIEIQTPYRSMRTWLSGRLGRSVVLPDLSSRGFKLLGARLLATSEGAAAMVLYEADGGERISFYLRPAGQLNPGTKGWREDRGLRARYWYSQGYGFAVVGRADDPRTSEVQNDFPAAM